MKLIINNSAITLSVDNDKKYLSMTSLVKNEIKDILFYGCSETDNWSLN